MFLLTGRGCHIANLTTCLLAKRSGAWITRSAKVQESTKSKYYLLLAARDACSLKRSNIDIFVIYVETVKKKRKRNETEKKYGFLLYMIHTPSSYVHHMYYQHLLLRDNKPSITCKLDKNTFLFIMLYETTPSLGYHLMKFSWKDLSLELLGQLALLHLKLRNLGATSPQL